MNSNTKTTIAMAMLAAGVFIHAPAHAMSAGSMSGAKVKPTPCSVQLWTGNTDTAAKCEAAGGTWNRGASAGADARNGGSSSGQSEVINNPALFIGRTNSMLNSR